MTDQQLLNAFETCTITHRQWDHLSHLRVGYLYSQQYGLQESIEQMVSGILKLNAVLCIPEGRRRGFHSTITIAWLLLVRIRMLRGGGFANSMEFVANNPCLMDKQLLEKYYSDSVLFSSQAKAQFVKPDLKPFATASSKLDPHFCFSRDREVGRNELRLRSRPENVCRRKGSTQPLLFDSSVGMIDLLVVPLFSGGSTPVAS